MAGKAKLAEYRKKRHFDRTPEPSGDGHKKIKSAAGGLYVIQKHDASRLHYDFRLELDGVLKSWAVPKGPSLNPRDKRLAVHVEDHPIEYGSFEGIIPEGQYGGGTVILWDRGKWYPEIEPHWGMQKGHLVFRLEGEKLRGVWQLVRMASAKDGDKNWLLFKSKDEYASDTKDILKSDRSVISDRTIKEMEKKATRVWNSRPARRSTAAPSARQRARAISKLKFDARSAAAELSGAVEAAQPGTLEPQLATLVDAVPEVEGWIHEIKFDGYRALAFIKKGEVRLITRKGNDWTAKFAAVAEAVNGLSLSEAILDGEVVVQKSDGTTDFQALQNVLKGARGQLRYYVFDVPFCEGRDLRRTPLMDRKGLLRQIIESQGDNDVIRFSDHVEGQGPQFFKLACKHHLEGVVSKRADSFYETRRSRTWTKTKCSLRQEFVIGGFTDPQNSREAFGALMLGVHEAKGRLLYCGKVGTGFDGATLRSVKAELQSRAAAESPFANLRGRLRGVHWTRPELVAEVEFGQWTRDGMLRHPTFRGLRLDKPAAEVVREQAADSEKPKGGEEDGVSATPKPGRSKKAPAPVPTHAPARRAVGRSSQPVVIAGVKLTNPGRVFYPEEGITKLELAQYYERVAEAALPFIADRPLSLKRCPEGWNAECFFQKHPSGQEPAAFDRVAFREKDETRDYLVVRDLKGLVALAQIGALEVHPLGCRADNVERPDQVIFDLDPGPGVSWGEVVQTARDLRDRLEKFELSSFVKTSGGKGLHIVSPVQRTVEWGMLKEFARLVSEQMVRSAPGKLLATMSKAQRQGKIFVDYLRNTRGATCVAAYSTRARAGATVSTPITWEELTLKLDPQAFTVRTVPERVAGMRDPWGGFFKTKQAIRQSMLKKAAEP